VLITILESKNLIQYEKCMNKYLPSKKFISILLSIVVALGIIFISLHYNKPKKITTNEDKQTQTENNAAKLSINNADTDSDGLKDWEETLWGTDSKKSDTDSDGTTDDNEIKAGRNPLKANTAIKGKEFNDVLENQKLIDQKKAEEDFKNLTTTEKISYELLLQYLKTGKTDSKLTGLEAQAIVDKALTYLPTVTYKTYSSKDLKVINSSTNEVLRDYANGVAKIILDNLMTKTESIDSIITDAANINSDEKLTEGIKVIFARFDPLIAKNKKTSLSLLNMTVPETFSSSHLRLLNSFEEIYEKQDLMKKSAEDIAMLVLIKSRYYKSVENLSADLLNIAAKVTSAKITFPNNLDYGYQLFYVIIPR
jgi:hypothetical protein